VVPDFDVFEPVEVVEDHGVGVAYETQMIELESPNIGEK
jgi:hypothetical protein